jgi:DNA-binding transcriptional LysR family regulator
MAEPRISFDALAAFAAFADTMNLTKAATALHISQPSLHAKIATLSRELGRPLYEKVGRRLVLTPDGEQVARFAREQGERIGRLLDELRVTPQTRPIVLAAGHAAYLHVRALRAAGVPWSVAVEIEGWPLTVHYAALGVGLAVVTGCVTPAPGLVARRVTDLPAVTYHAVHRRDASDDPRVAALMTAIRTTHARPGRRRAAAPPR